MKLFREQVFHLINNLEKENMIFQNKSKFSFISPLFEKSPSNIRKHYLKAKRDVESDSPHLPGRPSLLNDKQKNDVITHIKEQCNNNTPISGNQLLSFIQEEFEITPSTGWLDKFVAKNNDELEKLTAQPIELKRLED